jgi:hypothetical protein
LIKHNNRTYHKLERKLQEKQKLCNKTDRNYQSYQETKYDRAQVIGQGLIDCHS